MTATYKKGTVQSADFLFDSQSGALLVTLGGALLNWQNDVLGVINFTTAEPASPADGGVLPVHHERHVQPDAPGDSRELHLHVGRRRLRVVGDGPDFGPDAL